MTQKLPRKSAAATRHAMQVLATAKMLRDTMKPAEAQAKAYLVEKELAPKDRRTIIGPDGSDIGTLSLVAPEKKRGTGLHVVDPVAFAAWCEARGIEHHGKPSMEFPEWVTGQNNLETLTKHAGGELPDGVADDTQPGSPYIAVRQSADQVNKLRDSFTTAQGLLEAVTPNLIEEGDDK